MEGAVQSCTMKTRIHGTKNVAKKHHPVLDLAYWKSKFPLGRERPERYWVDTPGGVARVEQGRELAKAQGRLGPKVPSDVFVWSLTRNPDAPWLTRIGGKPWRKKGKPWPTDAKGIPLAFLGQICFADSMDLLPFKLPGEVALIFGTNRGGWISLFEGSALEWSPLKIKEKEKDRLGFDVPWTGELPFQYHGVVHRTVQYTNHEAVRPAFEAAGYKGGGYGVRSMQATSIGTYADLPQGWPFEEGDGHTLVAALSSFYFRGKWPLCDVPAPHQAANEDGSTWQPLSNSGDFGVGDAGCMWIYRDNKGKFRLDSACG